MISCSHWGCFPAPWHMIAVANNQTIPADQVPGKDAKRGEPIFISHFFRPHTPPVKTFTSSAYQHLNFGPYLS